MDKDRFYTSGKTGKPPEEVQKCLGAFLGIFSLVPNEDHLLLNSGYDGNAYQVGMVLQQGGIKKPAQVLL